MNSEKTSGYDKLSLCCASFCISVFAFLGGDTVNIIVSSFLFLLLSLVSLLLCVCNKIRTKSFVIFLICLFAFLGSSYSAFTRNTSYFPAEILLSEYEGIDCKIETEIIKLSSSGSNYAIYDANLLKIDEKKIQLPYGKNIKIRISSFGEDYLTVGEPVSFCTVLERPEKTLDGGFEFRKYLESKEVFLCCNLNGNYEVISQGKTSLLSRIHQRLKFGFTKYIGKGDSNYRVYISSCMLFGDKSGIDDYLDGIFRGSGLSHILCVSGLHLSILFGVVMGILGISSGKRKRRRFPASELVACGIAFTYMLFSGFSPSIMRAGFMLICTNVINFFIYYYRKLRRAETPDSFVDYTSLSSLLGSLFIICLVSPYSVYDIGLQLSFMSSLGIIIVVPLYNEIKNRIKPGFLNYFVLPVIVTLSAISFTFPIMAHSFGTFSSVSVFSNLAVAIITTPYLALLLFLAIFVLFPGGTLVNLICEFLGCLCSILATLLIKIAEFFSSFKFSVIEMNFDIGIFIVFFSCVMIVVFASIFKAKETIKVFCSVIFALLLFSFSTGFVSTVVNFNKPVLYACTLSKHPYTMISRMDTRIVFDFGEGLSKISQNKKLLGECYYDTNNAYVITPKENAILEDVYYNVLFFEKYCDIDVLFLPDADKIKTCNIDENAYRELVQKLGSTGDYILNFYTDEITLQDMKIEFSLKKESTGIYTENFAVLCSQEYNEMLSVQASQKAKNTVYFCKNAKDTEKGERKPQTNLYVSSHCVKYVQDAEKIQTQNIMEIR